MDDNLYACLNAEEHQTKIPGTIIMLQALELGIHSTWISYFNVKMVSELLCLPQKCLPSEILALGYPAIDIKKRNRKALDDIVFYGQYQK